MKFKIIKNRQLIKDSNFAGYEGENRAEKLEFDIPPELQEYTKTINFQTNNGSFFDILDSNIYIIKNNITQYEKVRLFLKFTKQINENEIEQIKTSVATLELKPSFDVDNEITEEEIEILDALIFRLEEATNRANTISQDLEEKVASDYYRGKPGDNYVITPEDYEEIESNVKKAIQPNLDNNLKSAKDYTDNAIIKDFKDISYNQDTATFVFTRHDNTTFTVDLPIEQTVKNGYYDETTKELVLVLVSDQEIRIPATGLIDDYTGVDSATIQLTISADNKITATIIGGSIAKTLLTTELQEEIDNKVNKTSIVYDEETETLSITI